MISVEGITYTEVITPSRRATPRRVALQIACVILAIAIFCVSCVGLYQVKMLTHQSQQEEAKRLAIIQQGQQIAGIQTEIVRPPLPLRLKIPKLHVNARIEYMGLTPKGEMDIPTNTSNVAWYSLGSIPGEIGSAVMAGHFNGENGLDGVFAHLSTLQTGDTLLIENTIGETIVFSVRETRMYSPGIVDEVFRESDRSHLNLVTCDGVWNINKKSYSKRLVVFADLIQ